MHNVQHLTKRDGFSQPHCGLQSMAKSSVESIWCLIGQTGIFDTNSKTGQCWKTVYNVHIQHVLQKFHLQHLKCLNCLARHIISKGEETSLKSRREIILIMTEAHQLPYLKMEDF